MRYHEFPTLVIDNRIRHLHLTLQDRRDGGAKTPNVTVKAIDLEYILDHIEDLEKRIESLCKILDDVGW